jgi:hypothetical protein
MNGADLVVQPNVRGLRAADSSEPPDRLPALIERARGKLAEARTAAEALEAKHVAEAALHYAKVAGAANEAHADCMRIIAHAEIRISREYRAAQERGEVAGRKDGAAVRDHVRTPDKVPPPTLRDLGIDRRRLNEFDALAQAGETAVEQAIDEAAAEAAAEGRAVTKAAVRKRLRRREGHVATKTKAKRPTTVGYAPAQRPAHLGYFSLLIRNMAETVPKWCIR